MITTAVYGLVDEEPVSPPRPSPSSNKVSIITYENRHTLWYLDRFKEINQRYCDYHGYKYIFYDSYSGENDMPPYWIKVKILYDLIVSNNGYDYLMWIDSDAVINYENMKMITIESYFANTDYTFIGAPDQAEWNSPFNAGVWIVKGNQKGKEIMAKWLSYYGTCLWQFDPLQKQWISNGHTASVHTDPDWAGICYEQGSFGILIMQDKHEYGNFIQMKEWYTLQFVDSKDNKYAVEVKKKKQKRKKIFVIHFAAGYKDAIEPYLNEHQNSINKMLIF
ncbi:unnamed protein product [Didymodactylos carnosus]|uniref:Uncharacterized protein n=1 Tax=Didymodactylos carnosus TaxID=1234261 RepID=A0A814D992_9BILA|nr:unnamed protein product [Didymodactylos carnosus]CAF1317063.1 unnamed protein product [Didymodactylos carnosus]CAF3727780.1 unnamed protein product [Didymodactylos carnosus]CAF4126169.1 unnamed protein product [Didymodactylos carnosus]